jgi:hypothetical protein
MTRTPFPVALLPIGLVAALSVMTAHAADPADPGR